MSDKEQLGRIEGKLDLLVPMVQKNDKRLNIVEKKQYAGITVFTLAWGAFLAMFDWGG